MISRMAIIFVWLGACVTLLTPTLDGQQTTASNNVQRSCREFVISFYNWYVTNVFTKPNGWLGPVLRYRSSAFSPDLRRVLKEYAQGPIERQVEIDRLDFDPFLNAQDNPDSFEARSVTQKGDRYFVELYFVWSGKPNAKPKVIPELTLLNGRWQFANFNYGNDNMVGILKQILEESRRSKASKTKHE